MRELINDSATEPSSSTTNSNSQSQSGNDEFSQSNSGSSEISGGQRDQEYSIGGGGGGGGRESTQGSTPSSAQDYTQGAAGRGTDSMSQQQTAGRVGSDAYGGGGAANARS
jgi:hypothetical protein